jgi:hypothetical protein
MPPRRRILDGFFPKLMQIFFFYLPEIWNAVQIRAKEVELVYK